MPLTTGELDRIRAELGTNVLGVGAEPYIGVQAFYQQVLLPYLREGTDTTSSTAVTASGYSVLTLASATGISVHDHVAIDVDSLYEYVTVRMVSGNTIGVILENAHPGSYPVTLDAGLIIIRECLAGIYKCRKKIDQLYGVTSGAFAGTLKKVDEIEFYDTKKSPLKELETQLDHWRDRLADVCGLKRTSLNHGGAAVGLY